jgi:D-sedoheptulose 7-phosphate isomerase
MTARLATADAAEMFARRDAPIAGLAEDAGALAEACWAMARRFHQGGRLLAFGTGCSAADAAHVVVEFVHPVIIGKRALPALGLSGRPDFRTELELFGEHEDIALGIASDPDDRVSDGLATARDRGMLTLALVGGADGVALPPGLDHVIALRSGDPRVVREGHVTAYHVLWELVHVFLDAPEVLA